MHKRIYTTYNIYIWLHTCEDLNWLPAYLTLTQNYSLMLGAVSCLNTKQLPNTPSYTAVLSLPWIFLKFYQTFNISSTLTNTSPEQIVSGEICKWGKLQFNLWYQIKCKFNEFHKSCHWCISYFNSCHSIKFLQTAFKGSQI